jgi:hypothetical protein
MKFPLEKYKFFIHTRKDGVKEVVAMSTYAGRYVRGIAKCSPEDPFDEEFGKKLAAARCNLKVAQKRQMAATKAMSEASIMLDNAKNRYLEMMTFVKDANKELDDAFTEINKLEESI